VLILPFNDHFLWSLFAFLRTVPTSFFLPDLVLRGAAKPGKGEGLSGETALTRFRLFGPKDARQRSPVSSFTFLGAGL